MLDQSQVLYCYACCSLRQLRALRVKAVFWPGAPWGCFL